MNSETTSELPCFEVFSSNIFCWGHIFFGVCVCVLGGILSQYESMSFLICDSIFGAEFLVRLTAAQWESVFISWQAHANTPASLQKITCIHEYFEISG